MACATSALEELGNKKKDFCHALYITEILRLILDNLIDDKRCLFRIAVSCKAFSDPALDILWAFMPSFDPFILLVPENVRQNLGPAYTLEVLSHMQCPEEEWRVFDSYARRVRYLAFGGNTSLAYQQLGILRPNCVVFPHLKALEFSMYIDPGPGTLMFPSSLRTLTICNVGSIFPCKSHSYTELALRQAAQDVPLLENLEITGTYDLYPGGGLHPLPFQALHTVKFSPYFDQPQPGAFDNVSHLLSTAPVRFLTVHASMYFQLFVNPNDKTSMFLNVKVLDISADPRTASDIVSRVGSPHLHTVIFKSLTGSRSGLGEFFCVLAQRPVPIRSLEVTLGPVVTTREASACVRTYLRILEPVVSAGLERLTVNIAMKRASRVRSSVWKRLDEGCWPALEHFEWNLADVDTGDSVISVIQS
ncbi:hypothetical protein PAXINDRAFT_101021 [Paxillus involutus ATCC 200175]|uniref:F-box domain-containing protein n=1 Tax=Paxillus involutus ATCC 200175 TaxID=664439 RepID=A0A0C9TZ32_PAXIN|nr:hypothetical protein PAXINDRAFT_101021 [Paxillus involutus ATCC 200175]